MNRRRHSMDRTQTATVVNGAVGPSIALAVLLVLGGTDGSFAQTAPDPALTDAQGRPLRPRTTREAIVSGTGTRMPTPATRPTLRENMLRSATGTAGAADPLADDLRLASPPATSRRSGDAADIADPDPLDQAVRPQGGAAAAGADQQRLRRPRQNNQGGDIVNNQAAASAADVDAALRAARPRIAPVAPMGPITPARAPEETGSVMPRPATQPTPRDLQADKRTEAEKEPDELAPLGLRTGGFTWLPAAEAGLTASSNYNSNASAKSGMVYTVAPELVGKSDWSRHELQLDLRGSYAGIPSDTSYDKPSIQANLRGRVDFSEEMRSDVKLGWMNERQPASQSDNPASTAIPSTVDTKTVSVGVTRDAGLLALTARTDLTRTDYSGGTSTSGASLGADVQNNTRIVGALRATYGSQGSLRPFVEVETSRRSYDQKSIAGTQRDGTGAAIRVGAVADVGPTLRGEISTGWGVEKAEDASLSTMSGWLIDGTLAWSPTRITVVKVTAKSEFVPTTLYGSPGALSRSLGVALEQSLRPDLVASVGATVSDKGYFGIDQSEKDLVLSSGLTYKVNRNLQTFVRGTWETFATQPASADYRVSTIMVGVRVQR